MFNFALLVNWTNCPLYTFYFAVLGQPAKKLHYSTSSQLGELKRQIKRDRENKHHTLKEEEGGGCIGAALGPGAAWLGRGDRKPSHSHAFRPSLGINSSKLDCKRGIILLLIADADACMHALC